VRALAASILAAVVALLSVAPAAAQQPDDAPSVLELTVTQLSATLGPGSVRPPDPPPDDLRTVPTPPDDLQLRALIEHVGDDPVPDLRVVVEVHPAVTTRSGLRQALDTPTGLVGSEPLHVHQQELRDGDASLGPGDIAGVEISIPREDVAWSGDAGGAVHPVRIAVLRGATVLTQQVTAAVWVEELPAEPLLTTAVWPLDAPPWLGPGPAYESGVDRDVRDGGRLDAQLRALERHPESGVLVAPPAHLLEDLRDRADGYVRTSRTDDGVLESRAVPPESTSARRANAVLQRLRAVVGDAASAPLARPYADADLTGLVADDTSRGLAGELARIGRLRLESLAERSSDQRAYLLPPGVDEAVLDLVPADTLLVPFDAIEGPDLAADPTLDPPVRDTATASGRPVTLLVGDPYLTDLLDEPLAGQPVLTAQRLAAETAMVYFEDPSADARALSVHPPEGWDPSAEEAQRMLRQLASAPWLRLTDPGTVAASARRGPAAELIAAEEPTLDDEQRQRLVEKLDDLVAAQEARSDPEASDLGGRSPAELRDALLRATSRWYAPGSEVADALLSDVDAAIERTLSDVVIASGSLITLTSDTGTIPVTLQRGAGGPLAVQVEVTSPARLVWPEGRRSETLLLEEGTTQTVSFPTEARSTGVSSVTVSVTDPSGRLELDRTTLSVRSTAISGPAMSAIGVLVVVLLLAGFVRRRPRRRLEVVR
jgi:hypothetical protein